MAVYIGFIACYPCNDEDVCAGDNIAFGQEATAVNHDDAQPGLDLCSPFCICSCCHSTINQPKLFSLIFDALKIRDFNGIVMPHNFQTIFHSIWQPPKLS